MAGVNTNPGSACPAAHVVRLRAHGPGGFRAAHSGLAAPGRFAPIAPRTVSHLRT